MFTGWNWWTWEWTQEQRMEKGINGRTYVQRSNGRMNAQIGARAADGERCKWTQEKLCKWKQAWPTTRRADCDTVWLCLRNFALIIERLMEGQADFDKDLQTRLSKHWKEWVICCMTLSWWKYATSCVIQGVTNLRIDGQTDVTTDGPTFRLYYRDTRMHPNYEQG